MKKILLPILMLLAIVGTSKAQTNAFTVGDINLPQNSEATLTVSFEFDAADTYTGYSFNLQLPEDLEFVMDTTPGADPTDVAYTMGSCYDATHGVTANLSEGMVKVVGISVKSKPLVGTSGTLLTFTIKPKSTYTVGRSFTDCCIKNIILVPVEGDKKVLSDDTFTVTIGEPEDFDLLLDENSTNNPTSFAKNKVVKVKRSIKADTWSTICLPFGIATQLLPTIFGEGYQLAALDGYSKEEDGILVNFTSNTTLKPNTPYIIKPSVNVTDFKVKMTANFQSKVTVGNGVSSKTETNEETWEEEVIWSLTGTYNSGEKVPEKNLFLNGNKFWYSKGNTSIKALRAYFYFKDILDEYVDNSSARVYFSVTDEDGNTTKIDGPTMEPIENGKVYNMAGQYVGEGEDMNRLPKGIYIVNGKKVIK